ncbi:MAG TPA: glucose-6-phosphate isomerase, partial [Pseudomonadales bacterium]|nr:glucose-6-phosphate isomerase [Pseudomonadales bacterium]
MAYQFTATPAFKALQAHQEKLRKQHMRDLFAADDDRFDKYSVEAAGLFLDFSKNLITDETLALLVQLADEAGLKAAIAAMFSGAKINNTEHRAAWHIALRRSQTEAPLSVTEEVNATLAKIENFVRKLHSGEWKGFTGKPIRHVVNIGIGGSDLGPCMAAEALKHYQQPGIQSHFVSNVDPTHIHNTLKQLDAETTLFIIESKTFTTLETKKNAEAARQWFSQFSSKNDDIAKHFVAVSTNLAEAQKFGIHSDNIFPMWDWVGGRYSLWSAIGLPIACAIGFDNFRKLLDGGNAMDQHFAQAEFKQNLPVLLALLSIWYSNFFDTASHAVVAYEQYLERFAS